MSKGFVLGLLLVFSLALPSFGESLDDVLKAVLTGLETVQTELHTVQTELQQARSEQANISSEQANITTRLTTLRDEQIPLLTQQLLDYANTSTRELRSVRVQMYTICGVTLVTSILIALLR